MKDINYFFIDAVSHFCMRVYTTWIVFLHRRLLFGLPLSFYADKIKSAIKALLPIPYFIFYKLGGLGLFIVLTGEYLICTRMKGSAFYLFLMGFTPEDLPLKSSLLSALIYIREDSPGFLSVDNNPFLRIVYLYAALNLYPLLYVLFTDLAYFFEWTFLLSFICIIVHLDSGIASRQSLLNRRSIISEEVLYSGLAKSDTKMQDAFLMSQSDYRKYFFDIPAILYRSPKAGKAAYRYFEKLNEKYEKAKERERRRDMKRAMR